MLAVLNFGVCEVEELRKLSLTLIVFRFNWFFSHDFETVLLEWSNAWTRSGKVNWINRRIKGRLRRLIEWLIETHVVGTKVSTSAHAHVGSEIAAELIGKSRLHHSILRESASIHVCHIGVRGHAHHAASHVGAESSRNISCKLSRILSHLGHVFHDLVKLGYRIQSCWLLLHGLLLHGLLLIRINNWLLICWLLNYRLCIEWYVIKEIESGLWLLLLRDTSWCRA